MYQSEIWNSIDFFNNKISLRYRMKEVAKFQRELHSGGSQNTQRFQCDLKEKSILEKFEEKASEVGKKNAIASVHSKYSY